MLRLDAGPDCLVFLPGFMTGAEAYRDLVTPVAQAGFTVIVAQLYARIPALLGRFTVEQEARAAADLVASQSGRVVIAGHSRGGQAAWRAAAMCEVNGVCLVDPVDGRGRNPVAPDATASPAGFECPALIIGAGLGGKCAPEVVNYQQFVRATPQARSQVIEDMGHADMLNGAARSFGRRLCGGGDDPDSARRQCSRLLTDFVASIR